MDYITLDKKNIWHPFTQAQTAEDPINIVRGKGVWLFDENGEKYLDAISSWWVTLHGHSDPYISQKIKEQFDILDHVIFAGFTHPKAVEISERLLNRLPSNQSRVFFSDNGSTAVEVGLKMAIQYWHNKGIKKNKILALEGAYHGDTFGAMSVGGRNAFNEPFEEMMFEVKHLTFPSNSEMEERSLLELQHEIDNNKEGYACFIYEPLVQGAAGMRIYSKEFLKRALSICKANNIICIADEVMVGFYRTGKMFASLHVDIDPDIVCMSKGITGGVLPLGLTSCTENIYEAYLSDDYTKTFFHGHSFTGNPITCAAACASLDLLEKETTLKAIKSLEDNHGKFASKIAHLEAVAQVKMQGTILSIELASEGKTDYFNAKRKKIYKYFISRNILIRPLGNVIYLIPPYCITDKELNYVYEEIIRFLTLG